MNKTDQLTSRIIDSLHQVDADAWDACANPIGAAYNPFLSHAFLLSLEDSRSAVGETGWGGAHILVEDASGKLLGAMLLYLKTHSRGEYVFDHGWAEAYERAGGRYYPKLLSAVPFTPVTGRRLLVAPTERADHVRRLLLQSAMTVTEQNDLSSMHINFVATEELPFYDERHFLRREGRQFHFQNAGFESFDAFLASLASRKRKAVRKERKQALEAGLTIRNLTGGELRPSHWDAFFTFYMDTGSRKWGTPYLTRAFFDLIHERMADKILLSMAFSGETPVAGALNFIGSDTLYGRYWGMNEFYPGLHFELCYYQAIEYAIDHQLTRVEAGAQGEHKLARGYLPTPTYSMHYLPDQGFREAVSHFLSHEQRYIDLEHDVLSEHSPFRKTDEDGACEG